MLTCITTFLTAQGAGIRYVNGVPTSATYTPKIPKGESVRCFSLTTGKYYYWDITVFPPLWREEILNNSVMNFHDGGGIKAYANQNPTYFSLGDNFEDKLPLVREEQNVPNGKRRWIFTQNPNNQSYGLGYYQRGGYGDLVFGADDGAYGKIRYENYGIAEDDITHTAKFEWNKNQDWFESQRDTSKYILSIPTRDDIKKEGGLENKIMTIIDDCSGESSYIGVTGSLYSKYFDVCDGIFKRNAIEVQPNKQIKFTQFGAGRNDGISSNFAWFDDDGYIRKSPTSQLQSNNIYNTNGSLTANRTVTGTGFGIQFNTSYFGALTNNTIGFNAGKYIDLTANLGLLITTPDIRISSLPTNNTANKLLVTNATNQIFTRDISTLSGGGTTYTAGPGISIAGSTISATDNSVTNELPTFTTSTTAPAAPKIGDVWNDTSLASSTKPTILEKKWNGSTWYTTTGASQSSLSWNAGVLGLSINGQISSNTVNIDVPVTGTWTFSPYSNTGINDNNVSNVFGRYVKIGNIIDVDVKFDLLVGNIQANSKIIDFAIKMIPFPIANASVMTTGSVNGYSNSAGNTSVGSGPCTGNQQVGFTAPLEYYAKFQIQFPVVQAQGTTITANARIRYSI